MSAMTVMAAGGGGMDSLAAEITVGVVFFLGMAAIWWFKVGKRR
ncbi:hypothetical protein ACIP93_10320 [Streptomyces sp. NPDC088745]